MSGVPEDLSESDWKRLWRLLEQRRPWLTEDNSELAWHCNRQWVRQQVEETLSYWASVPRVKRSDWVMTCLNRIYSQDTREWRMLEKVPPSAKLWKAAKEMSN